MRIRLSMPPEALTPAALEAALEATTLTNQALLETGRYPTAKDAIRAGVRWKPEPPGDEHFDILPTVLSRKWGDCDDLAPYHAASLRVTGEDEDARAIVRRSGPRRWHALVQRGDGGLEDPSVWAGMKKRGPAPRYTPVATPIVVGGVPDGRLAVHTAPYKGRSYARVDIPHMMPGEASLASCNVDRDPHAAMLRALRGARIVGEAICCDDETMGRIVGAEELLRCRSPRELAAVLQAMQYVSPQLASDVVGFADDTVGFGFGALAAPIFNAATGAAGGALKGLGLGSSPKGGAAAQAGRAVAPAGGGGGGSWGGSAPGTSRGGAGGNNWLINQPPPIIVRY